MKFLMFSHPFFAKPERRHRTVFSWSSCVGVMARTWFTNHDSSNYPGPVQLCILDQCDPFGGVAAVKQDEIQKYPVQSGNSTQSINLHSHFSRNCNFSLLELCQSLSHVLFVQRLPVCMPPTECRAAFCNIRSSPHNAQLVHLTFCLVVRNEDVEVALTDFIKHIRHGLF